MNKKKCHIIDLDSLVNIEQKVWVINKEEPNIPILRISKSEFNLYKNGIYKKDNNKVEFNSKVFWFPESKWNELKIISKKMKFPLTNIAISMQEFLNPDIIEDVKYSFNENLLSELKNINEDIYLISSKQVELRSTKILEKIKNQLLEDGITITHTYFISETFHNKNEDKLRFNKIKILLQHLVGYKTDKDVFIDETPIQYSIVEYYDIDFNTLKISDEINTILKVILYNTNNVLKSIIKEDIKYLNPLLILNRYTDNTVNQKESKKVKISLFNNDIKKFEQFIFNESKLLYNLLYKDEKMLKDIFKNMSFDKVFYDFKKEFKGSGIGKNFKSPIPETTTIKFKCYIKRPLSPYDKISISKDITTNHSIIIKIFGYKDLFKTKNSYVLYLNNKKMDCSDQLIIDFAAKVSGDSNKIKFNLG